MPMSPRDRKAELIRNGRTMTEIADSLDLTVSHVAQVIRGIRRSPAVEKAVADAIGKPVKQVFGAAA